MNPLDVLVGRVALARRRFYQRHPELRRRLQRPVVSIGNLSVGGAGKTPVVEAIARRLCEQGWHPAVLSRGYGRSAPADGVVVVSDGRTLLADLPRSGDEPLMLARRLPGVAVLVSPDRSLAGTIAERHLGCDVHLLDDGFQHFHLHRTVDVLVSGDEELAHPHLLPIGRLREPLQAAHAADALLWTGAGDLVAAATRLGIGEAFRVVRRQGPVETRGFGGTPVASGARVVAVAGIARPARFFGELRGDGFDVAEALVFPDHHRFDARDAVRMARSVERAGAAAVLTTEKDMMRLLPLRPLPFALAWRGVEARFEPAEAFDAWLAARIGAPADRGAAA